MLKIYAPYYHIKTESSNKAKYVALLTHIKTAAFLYTADSQVVAFLLQILTFSIGKCFVLLKGCQEI